MRLRPCARGSLAALLAALACGSMAPAALADGDPASDVLLYQQAFFPYASPSPAAKAELLGAVAAAKRAGFTVRVAVIQSRRDLGADPELFAKPQLYAKFLDAELRSARYLGALVVVMPQGFGVAAGGTLTHNGTRYTPRPAGALLRAAARLPPATGGGTSGSGSSSRSIEVAAGLAVLALAAIAMIGVGIRRSRASEPG